MILTTESGVPIDRPTRDEFPAGIDGTIEFMRAVHAFRDRVANEANRAFAETFTNELRRPAPARAA